MIFFGGWVIKEVSLNSGFGWLVEWLSSGDETHLVKRRLRMRDGEGSEHFCFEHDKFEMHIRHPLEILAWR